MDKEEIKAKIEAIDKQIEMQVANLNQTLGYKKCLEELLNTVTNEEISNSSTD